MKFKVGDRVIVKPQMYNFSTKGTILKIEKNRFNRWEYLVKEDYTPSVFQDIFGDEWSYYKSDLTLDQPHANEQKLKKALGLK